MLNASTSLGALMLLAWMLTGSVGTFIASFYKPDWPNQTLLGQKVWFQVDVLHTHIHMCTYMHTVMIAFSITTLPFLFRVSIGSSSTDDANCDFDHWSLLPPIFLQERLEQGTTSTHTHTQIHNYTCVH